MKFKYCDNCNKYYLIKNDRDHCPSCLSEFPTQPKDYCWDNPQSMMECGCDACRYNLKHFHPELVGHSSKRIYIEKFDKRIQELGFDISRDPDCDYVGLFSKDDLIKHLNNKKKVILIEDDIHLYTLDLEQNPNCKDCDSLECRICKDYPVTPTIKVL